MVNFTFSATLPLPADVYFLERDTEAFRRLLGKLLKLGTLEIVDSWRQNETKGVVRLVTRPSARKYIPEAVLRRFPIIDISFEDYLEFHTHLVSGPSFEVLFQSIPPLFHGKIDIKGRLRIEPLDEHNCVQTITGEVDFKVFGLKRLVESIVVDSVGKSYRQLPKVLHEWIRIREEILEQKGLDGLMRGAPDLDWLPNAQHRKDRSLQYHSPLLKKEHDFNSGPNLSWSEKSASEIELVQEGIEEKESSTESTPVNSVQSSNLSDRTKCVSEYESSVQFFDALEQFPTDSSQSWSSPMSSLNGNIPDPMTGQPSFMGGKCSRRRLLSGCGLSQPISSADSQDEVIRKNSIPSAAPKPVLTAPVTTERFLTETQNTPCCHFRRCRCSEEVKRRCLCLSAF